MKFRGYNRKRLELNNCGFIMLEIISFNILVLMLSLQKNYGQVRDVFYNDFRGRKVTVLAPSRGVAASAIRTLLFHLVSESNINQTKFSLGQSEWKYMDLKHEMHGPYSSNKMFRWAQQGAFPNEAFPIQHVSLHCWLPLWFLQFVCDQNGPRDGLLMTPSMAESDPEEVVMMDWEETVVKLNADRQKGSLVQSNVVDLEEFQNSFDRNDFDARPMDYDVSNAVGDLALSNVVRVVVVIDTNVLLSHLTFTERTFSRLLDQSPAIEAILLVPWIVLCELDKLKDHKNERLLADAARLALRRLRLLISQRDSFVKAQSSMEHAQIAKHADGLLEHARLKNDDYILNTCLEWDAGKIATLRSSGTRAGVLLLSNDTGLCTRARANGIVSFTADEFSAAAGDLSKVVLSLPSIMYHDHSTELEPLRRHVFERKEHPENGSIPCQDGLKLEEESDPVISTISSILQTYLVPAVAYYRQQDLRDLWVELLEEDLRPPWSAPTVLKVLIRHETTFWGVFSDHKKHFLEMARKLEVMLRKYSRCPSDMPVTDSAVAVQSCLELFMVLQRGLEKPLSDDPPDPSSVPDFVTFGQARAALIAGIQKLSDLIHNGAKPPHHV